MDPNEALENLRSWSAEDGDGQVWLERGPEQFQALDEWLVKGGFLPKGWEGPLTMTAAGNWTDNERAVRRLATVFDRATRDDEELDRLITGIERAYGSVLRDRLIRLLAREVIEEANRERAKIEEMMNSQVTRTWIHNATRQAMMTPSRVVLVNPDADLPGFTPEGMRLIREARERNAAENDE
jgi:hypothetical protein